MSRLTAALGLKETRSAMVAIANKGLELTTYSLRFAPARFSRMARTTNGVIALTAELQWLSPLNCKSSLIRGTGLGD